MISTAFKAVGLLALALAQPLRAEELTWNCSTPNATVGEECYGDLYISDVDHPIIGQTRAYGLSAESPQVPGPTIRIEACKTYHLTLHNEIIEVAGANTAWNDCRQPSTTNLHTHGLHMSGDLPADDVVCAGVSPGEELTYTYAVPCDHQGGTFWYHPHFHGSAFLQTSSGAAGPLIVYDPERQGYSTGGKDVDANATDYLFLAGEESFMDEQIVFIQEIPYNSSDMNQCKNQARDTSFFNDDSVIEAICPFQSTGLVDQDRAMQATKSLYMINGTAVPDISIELNKWTRMRVIFAGAGQIHAFRFGNASVEEQCEVMLLALDGVYLQNVPRALPSGSADGWMLLSPSARVDVAVHCTATAGVEIQIRQYVQGNGLNILTDPLTIATLSSEGDGGETRDLPDWTPCRPYHLMDLRNETANNTESMEIALLYEPLDTNTGNPDGLSEFPESHLPPYFEAQPDTVQEWDIFGAYIHPVHLHVVHMQQVLSVAPEEACIDGFPWYLSGDFVDTVMSAVSMPNGPATIRFRTERYGGKYIFHCHQSPHADYGAMVGDIKVAYNTDGLDASLDGLNPNQHGQGPNVGMAALHPGTCGDPDLADEGFGYGQATPPSKVWADTDGGEPLVCSVAVDIGDEPESDTSDTTTDDGTTTNSTTTDDSTTDDDGGDDTADTGDLEADVRFSVHSEEVGREPGAARAAEGASGAAMTVIHGEKTGMEQRKSKRRRAVLPSIFRKRQWGTLFK